MRIYSAFRQGDSCRFTLQNEFCGYEDSAFQSKIQPKNDVSLPSTIRQPLPERQYPLFLFLDARFTFSALVIRPGIVFFIEFRSYFSR
ncbi:MAG TPA: hypothetical protein PK949_05645, partial [Dysgonamonadaceae bacterium]|nr:hypothetical protein [Dysgonamonadaceae bacterium]